MNQTIYMTLAIVLAVSVPRAATAGFITIGSGDTIINFTNNAGTVDTGVYAAGAPRDEDTLVNGLNLSGSPLTQAASAANSGNYWNSGSLDTEKGGVLIDLGQIYRLDALQLYGYNITDGGGSFSDRSLGSFTIWTATDSSAVTTVGGTLLVNDLTKFSQRGAGQTMADPSNAASLGETYLFGNASQPSEVGGPTHLVTGSFVTARYLFFRDMLGQPDNSETIIGLGEIRAYGVIPEPIPEPSTGILIPAALALFGLRRKTKRRTKQS